MVQWNRNPSMTRAGWLTDEQRADIAKQARADIAKQAEVMQAAHAAAPQQPTLRQLLIERMNRNDAAFAQMCAEDEQAQAANKLEQSFSRGV